MKDLSVVKERQEGNTNELSTVGVAKSTHEVGGFSTLDLGCDIALLWSRSEFCQEGVMAEI